MGTYTVYILRCSDGSYYTGMTSDLSGRLSDHQSGVHLNAYTKTRRPVTLVYSSDFTEVMQAISWEKTLKRWSRAKKEALIHGDYDALPELAKNAKRRNILLIQKNTRKSVMVSPVEP